VPPECELEPPESDVVRLQSGPGPQLTVAMPGEIDLANAGQVRAELAAALARGAAVVIADMSMTSFCDCAGVSALLAAARSAESAGCQLRVVARADAVLRIFGLTGLDTALPLRQPAAAPLAVRPDGKVIWLSRRRRTAAAGSVPRPGQPRCP
jgi:anti-sigma B factor antagonist